MRAVSLAEGVNMPAVVKAAAEEIESYIKATGELEGSFVVISVRSCSDSRMESGAAVQRRPQPR